MVILESLQIAPPELEARTGWAIKPEGACKGDRCVPLPDGSTESVEVAAFAEKLRMPLLHDEAHGLWCLGPEAGAAPLASAEAPDFTLPDWKGSDFSLVSMRGTKVLLLAWASW